MGSRTSKPRDGDNADVRGEAHKQATIRRLSEQDAWDIAMKWRASLRGAVRLVVDRDGPMTSIVESYAWIQIDLSLIGRQIKRNNLFKSPDPASIARASAISWLHLSQCAGYGGRENPPFWKRVFRQLQDDTLGTRHFAPVRFFDQAGHVFPRFIVTASVFADKDAFDKSLRVVCGLPGYVMERQVVATLRRVENRLRPYMPSDPATHTHTVDVCILIKPYACISVISHLSKLIADVNAATSTRPFFRIQEVKFQDLRQLNRDHRAVEEAYQLIQSLPVRIGLLQFHLALSEVTPREKAECVSAVFGLHAHGSQAKTTTVTFPRRQHDALLMPSIASALPFATSIHTIHLTMSSYEEHHQHLAWLAYAIFHPEAQNSSWRHLALSKIKTTSHALGVWRMMACGNNLLSVLNGEPAATCDAYYSAQLPRGTAIQVEASFTAEKLLPVEDDAGRVVDLCGVSSLEPSTWGDWVAVIVPAYGLGWVQADKVCDVRARPPSRPTLTGLALSPSQSHIMSESYVQPVQALLEIMEAVGANLIYLDIRAYRCISSTKLQRVLNACPELRSLVVSHDGEYWSTANVDSTEPSKLQELDLRVSQIDLNLKVPSKEHVQSSLRHLRAVRLRVQYSTQRGTLSTCRGMVEQFLNHTPQLQYIHWYERKVTQIRLTVLDDPMMDATSQERTADALTQLGIQSDHHHKYLYADAPLRVRCAVAFLSVIRNVSSSHPLSSVMARLGDRGVLTNIFQFATSPVRREIYVDK